MVSIYLQKHIKKVLNIALLAITGIVLAACSQEEVYRDLSVRDANEMTALLRDNDINATRENQGENLYRLTVPGDDFARSVQLLSRAGYPKEDYRDIAQVFPGDGLVVSPFEQRARMTFAMNQELSRTISDIEGVASARVHVVIPEDDVRSIAPKRSSASVVVHHRASVDPTTLSAKVRLIVANAVPKLEFEDVSVAFFEADDMPVMTASQQMGSNAVPADILTPQDANAITAQSPRAMLPIFAPAFLWIAAICSGIGAVLMVLRRARLL